jgi:hypothetical protein
MQPLLTSKEYAAVRRCSDRTIERERESGDGCPYVQLGRRIYYRREDVERFINAHVRGKDQVSNDGVASASPRRRRGRPPKAQSDAGAAP